MKKFKIDDKRNVKLYEDMSFNSSVIDTIAYGEIVELGEVKMKNDTQWVKVIFNSKSGYIIGSTKVERVIIFGKTLYYFQTIFFPLFIVGFLIYCFILSDEVTNELKQVIIPQWEIANNTNSVDSYKTFLTILNNEVEKYYNTSNRSTAEGFKEKYKKKAEKRIDEVSWRTANNKDKISSFIDYIHNNPKGEFLAEAHLKIRELACKDTQDIIPLIKSLQYWNESGLFYKDLESVSWQPHSIEEKIHLLVAQRNGVKLKEIWPLTKNVLLKDVESLEYSYIENALYAFIGIGNEEIISELLVKLNEYGNKTMAEAFLNCGNPVLSAAAKKWAESHGYTILNNQGIQTVEWGGFR